MFVTLLFILLAGFAIGCAISMVVQQNPLYSAVSLIGVFISLASLYLLLAAPFIAAVQVIVYAGAIMVLVVFVIMLLNVEQEERRPFGVRQGLLIAVLAAALFAEATFTASIGKGLFTQYLLPFEITSVLLLMAIVGAISLARQRSSTVKPELPTASSNGSTSNEIKG
jgi:NADH-quinone oxidoreductase subunit J